VLVTGCRLTETGSDCHYNYANRFTFQAVQLLASKGYAARHRPGTAAAAMGVGRRGEGVRREDPRDGCRSFRRYVEKTRASEVELVP